MTKIVLISCSDDVEFEEFDLKSIPLSILSRMQTCFFFVFGMKLFFLGMNFFFGMKVWKFDEIIFAFDDLSKSMHVAAYQTWEKG